MPFRGIRIARTRRAIRRGRADRPAIASRGWRRSRRAARRWRRCCAASLASLRCSRWARSRRTPSKGGVGSNARATSAIPPRAARACFERNSAASSPLACSRASSICNGAAEGGGIDSRKIPWEEDAVMVDTVMDTRDRAVAPSAPPAATSSAIVREYREILLWPLQLEPLAPGQQIQKHWQLLQTLPGGHAWSEVQDEFQCIPCAFQKRHYSEFVTFLPSVQRFLYGEGPHRAANTKPVESSLRVFRRRDIAMVRVTPRAGDPAIVLDVAHIDLYFFYDMDVVILAVEVFANDLPFD